MGVKSISRILKQLREEKDVTLEQIEVATGIGFSLLSKYERGSVEPSLGTLKRLAEYYDVSADFLFGYTEEKRPIVSSEKLLELYSKLNEDKRKKAIEYLTFLGMDFSLKDEDK